MKQQDIKNILQNLEERKVKIEKILSEFAKKGERPGDYDVQFPEHDQDMESNAQAFEEMAQRKALDRELEEELQEINKTIERIKDSNYGTCKKCSLDIEEQRLKVIPTASLCSSCASKKHIIGG